MHHARPALPMFPASPLPHRPPAPSRARRYLPLAVVGARDARGVCLGLVPGNSRWKALVRHRGGRRRFRLPAILWGALATYVAIYITAGVACRFPIAVLMSVTGGLLFWYRARRASPPWSARRPGATIVFLIAPQRLRRMADRPFSAARCAKNWRTPFCGRLPSLSACSVRLIPLFPVSGWSIWCRRWPGVRACALPRGDSARHGAGDVPRSHSSAPSLDQADRRPGGASIPAPASRPAQPIAGCISIFTRPATPHLMMAACTARVRRAWRRSLVRRFKSSQARLPAGALRHWRSGNG